MTPNDEVEELAIAMHRKFHTRTLSKFKRWGQEADFIKENWRRDARDFLSLGYSKQSPSSGLRPLDKREVHKIIFEFLHHPDTYSDLDIKESTSSINCFRAITELATDEIVFKFGTKQEMPTEDKLVEELVNAHYGADKSKEDTYWRYIAKAVLALIERKGKE